MATGRASGEASSSSRSDYNKMPGHWLLARMGKRVLRPRAVVRGPGRGQAALRAGMAAARRERRLRCPAHIDRAHAPAELAASVPNHIDLGDLIDESVLSGARDLVVISPNHSQEAQLARDLEDSDIAVLTMPNSWDDFDDAYDNILLVGEAIGAEATAQAVVANMKQRERQVQDRLDDLGDRPAVMILTNVAGVPFMIGPGVSTTDLVQRAGGSDASYALGVTTSISPRHGRPDRRGRARPDSSGRRTRNGPLGVPDAARRPRPRRASGHRRRPDPGVASPHQLRCRPHSHRRAGGHRRLASPVLTRSPKPSRAGSQHGVAPRSQGRRTTIRAGASASRLQPGCDLLGTG